MTKYYELTNQIMDHQIPYTYYVEGVLEFAKKIILQSNAEFGSLEKCLWRDMYEQGNGHFQNISKDSSFYKCTVCEYDQAKGCEGYIPLSLFSRGCEPKKGDGE